jgi:uncharacterized NAD(P)/FAD-binding protein YdhS
MDGMTPSLRHLVMIGGGQSGKGLLAAMAETIARGERALARLRVTIVESGFEFGTGLAWSRRYALDEHLSSLAAPNARVAYGDRQQTQFHGLVRLLQDLAVGVTLLPGRTATAVEPGDESVHVTIASADGVHETLTADFVVVGTGHWRVPDPLDGCPGYHASPWPAKCLQDAVLESEPASAARPKRVLILGAYLNGIDAVFSLALRTGRFISDRGTGVRFEGPSNFQITLASRSGWLPKVWGHAPAPYTPRYCTAAALDALIADPAGDATLPLDRAFALLACELRCAGARPRRLSPPRFPDAIDRLRRTRRGTTVEQLHVDIAGVTQAGRRSSSYDDAREPEWQRVMFGTLPLWSEYSHRFSAEDQALFDRELRTQFFNYSMPMTFDNAVRIEAMMRSGHLRVMALGPGYALRPSRRDRGFEVQVPWRAEPFAFTDVVNALGQSSDVTRHPAPVVRQMLRNGIAQPGSRAFRRNPRPIGSGGTWQGLPIVMRGGAPHLVTGGLLVDPSTRELVPGDRARRSTRPSLFAMGPPLIGQFVDAQGIGQIERDARAIVGAVARALA